MEAVREITTGSNKNRSLPSKSISDCGKSYVTRERKKKSECSSGNDVHMIGDSRLLNFPSPPLPPPESTAGAATTRLEVKNRNL